MKINKIMTNTNFGLKRTLNYKNVEDILVQSIAEQSNNTTFAKTLTEKIKKQLPNALLGTNSSYTNFILIKNIKDKSLVGYDLGNIDYRNPLQTLTNLYKNLSNFSKNHSKRKIYANDISIKYLNGLKADRNKKIREVIFNNV